MASLLLILLTIVFVVIIILLSLGTYVLSALFGGFVNLKNVVCRLFGWDSGGQQTHSAQSSSSNKTSSRTSSDKGKSKSPPSEGKVFNQDEGTYIDFEEVK